MDSIQNIIRQQIESKRRGTLLFPVDFHSFGSREAVRASLSRLCKSGVITRVAQGVYCRPKTDKWNGEPILPSLEEIAKGIAKRDKARIVPTGDYALNVLGISTQMPVNVVFITDGPQRKVSIGQGRVIQFKHSEEMRMFAYHSSLMQMTVMAMREIGETNLTASQINVLKSNMKNVSEKEFNNDIQLAPVWVAKILKS
ncbi:MAG: type IV toxin-antitoxin system AbiEi family antitoxin domain-containing protein [Muribaculaceae bacterium]|nr:type IV toxin-antitoxin system AbiEi family antitoxin domain-containing protein [Muribaculaceae bacterium]